MPETYTGNEGTAAFNAGLTIMDGTEDRRDGWLAINKTRDFIVQLFSSISLTWESVTGKPSLFASRSDMVTRPSGGGTIEDAVNATFGLAQSKIGAEGGTITGHLYLPNSSPATSGYTVAYINNDGRLSKGASSERYKENIVAVDPGVLGDLWPTLFTYEMIGGDGSAKIGYIAERLAEHPDLAQFVVHTDLDGVLVPDSIDFIALLIAQNAQLHQRLAVLEAR